MESWHKQGWPGPPSPDNAVVLRVARLWWLFDDLEVAVAASGFEVPASRAEGYLMRLGMAYKHYRDRAEEERKRGRR